DELSTKQVGQSETAYLYEAKLEHFSYFAITAKSEAELSWFRHLIPPKFATNSFVLFGLVILIVFLLVLYWFVREK
ncbi:hypothetical protein HYU21_01600, partial [Candidatus Woesearchaeota archaeon]|nr:hypothetical protein [Candidatus Woesearchaeota archaeon]